LDGLFIYKNRKRERILKKVFFIFVILVQIPSIVWADTCPAGYQPAEYQVLEYIESTGTQYIDTGIIYSDVLNARLRLDAIMLDSSTSVRGIGRSGSYFGGPFVGLRTDGFFGYSAGVGDQKTGVAGSSNERYKYDLNIPASTYVVKDGNNNVLVNVTNITKSTRSETPSCILFGYYGNPNTGGGPYKLRSMKIYSSQFYDNDTLVRDFVPVRRLADNVLGMLDKVNNVFYTNAGTGTFIAGSETYETIYGNGGGCTVCPPNTYKDTAGDFPCTPCPSTTFSKSGSTSINDCGHVMHVGDKIYFLGPQKLTTPALHVRMPDGTIYYGSLYQQQTE
jgi:hypothetical protein